MSVPRKPPFALWVENVDPERVDAKDLWEAFARYGDMCKPREHGARAVEILPDSKAAIVNFASYEHACAALKGLQGALIGKITRPGLAISWHKRQDDPPQKQAVAHADKGPKERPPFFGLWVGNVHASLVHEEEFRNAFEKYGDLCNPQVHGVPSVNILPESSSAFVNFSRYEDANAARKGLQGKLVGGAGPLRINASDLMQEYEQQQQAQQHHHPHPPTPNAAPHTFNKQPGQPKQLARFGSDADAYPLGLAEPADLAVLAELCSDEGPLYELLGGEIYVYEAGDVIKLFESKPAPAAPVH